MEKRFLRITDFIKFLLYVDNFLTKRNFFFFSHTHTHIMLSRSVCVWGSAIDQSEKKVS